MAENKYPEPTAQGLESVRDVVGRGGYETSRSAHGRTSVFHPEFVSDLRYWIKTDRKVALRVLNLVEAVMRDPFSGIGKPEPLKYLLSGTWSRRLTEEHRVVYLVREDAVDFLQARYHY